jgi:hypothetical protein
MSRLRRMPSPAMVVAFIALAVALGGTAWAAVNGASIKRNSIPGNRLKKKTVTGNRIKTDTLGTTQIAESRLGKVPKARRADLASNASRLGGAKAANYPTFGTKAIPKGATVTGVFGLQHFFAGGSDDHLRQAISLPGVAPANLTDTTVNFKAAAGVADADATCTGTAASPTAPAGKVCLYLTSGAGLGSTFRGEALPGLPGSRRGFVVRSDNAAASGTGVYGVWAYTAP